MKTQETEFAIRDWWEVRQCPTDKERPGLFIHGGGEHRWSQAGAGLTATHRWKPAGAGLTATHRWKSVGHLDRKKPRDKADYQNKTGSNKTLSSYSCLIEVTLVDSSIISNQSFLNFHKVNYFKWTWQTAVCGTEHRTEVVVTSIKERCALCGDLKKKNNWHDFKSRNWGKMWPDTNRRKLWHLAQKRWGISPNWGQVHEWVQSRMFPCPDTWFLHRLPNRRCEESSCT